MKRACLKHNKNMEAIDIAVTTEGWKIVGLIRFTPIPISFVSYLFGFTSIRLADYVLGTLTTSMHVAAWMYIGMSLKKIESIKKKKGVPEVDQKTNSEEFALIVFEIFMVFLVAFIVGWKAKRILDKKLKDLETDQLRDDVQRSEELDSNHP
jgi:uncharacterized membrane protein YdjX (TVP38/TMEM64 family)